MPTITAAEIAIVVAAVLLLYVAPYMLTLLDPSRRRQAQGWASQPLEAREPRCDELGANGTTPVEAGTESDLSRLAQTEAAAASIEAQGPMASSIATPLEQAPAEPPTAASIASSLPGEPIPLGVVVETAEPAALARAVPFPDALRFAGYEPPAATPYPATDGYRFRVEDLHRARLADWPPDSVQSDPARQRLWSEAARLAATHDAAISTADLVAPIPVRSVCLGACERRSTGMTLHFLLFPDLWPVAPEQAVARAVFEIDSGSGTIRSSVDILPPAA